MNAVSDIIVNTDGILSAAIQDIYTSLVPTAQNIWAICFILWLCVYGVMLSMGKEGFNQYKLTMTAIKCVTVLVLATQWPYFQIIIYDFFTKSSDALANVILASGSKTADKVTTGLGEYYDQSMTVADRIFDGAGSFDLSAYFYCAIIFLSAIAVTGYALFLIILSKIAVSLLLALAPLMLLLLMFENTRGFFEGWIRTLVNYAVIPLLAYTLLSLLLAISDDILENLITASKVGGENIGNIMPFALISVVSFLVLMQVTTIASSIAGGFALSTMGAYASATRPLRHRAAAGARYAGNRAAGYASTKAAQTGQKLTNVSRMAMSKIGIK